MTGKRIQVDDPIHAAAIAVINAMHEYWKVAGANCAVRWLECTDGRLIIFTRGEYRTQLLQGIGENLLPDTLFEQIETPDWGFDEE